MKANHQLAKLSNMKNMKNMSRGLKMSINTASRDVANGFFDIFHNGLAVFGLFIAVVVVFGLGRPELRHSAETQLFGWLQARQTAMATSATDQVEEVAVDLNAVDRATAVDPADLPKQQAAVAYWLSKKYRVAPEPISALVAEAYAVGSKVKLEPTLILAIMAIESGFNPFAQSPVGAQGLMQVMTKIHSDKYEDFGGKMAAFDPITNLRVGVKVLQNCIAQAGSIEGGLKFYVGAANLPNDGGYAAKVVAEYANLYKVAYGKQAPMRNQVASTGNNNNNIIRTSAVPAAAMAKPEQMPIFQPAVTPAIQTNETSPDKIAYL